MAHWLALLIQCNLLIGIDIFITGLNSRADTKCKQKVYEQKWSDEHLIGMNRSYGSVP